MEAARNQDGQRESSAQELKSKYLTIVGAFSLGLIACKSADVSKTFSCSLARNETVYGLSGEWAWSNGRSPRRICLHQVSPVRVRGLTELNGKVLPLIGAVAPTGAIFITTVSSDSANFSFVAKRQADSIAVDWLAEPGVPDRYSPGSLYKKK